MDKKGVELSIQAVIVLVLGLIVLVILIVVVRSQIMKGTERYTTIGKEAEKEFTDQCAGIFRQRTCEAACTTGFKEVLPVPKNGWTDCESGESCCKKA